MLLLRFVSFFTASELAPVHERIKIKSFRLAAHSLGNRYRTRASRSTAQQTNAAPQIQFSVRILRCGTNKKRRRRKKCGVRKTLLPHKTRHIPRGRTDHSHSIVCITLTPSRHCAPPIRTISNYIFPPELSFSRVSYLLPRIFLLFFFLSLRTQCTLFDSFNVPGCTASTVQQAFKTLSHTRARADQLIMAAVLRWLLRSAIVVGLITIFRSHQRSIGLNFVCSVCAQKCPSTFDN